VYFIGGLVDNTENKTEYSKPTQDNINQLILGYLEGDDLMFGVALTQLKKVLSDKKIGKILKDVYKGDDETAQ